MSRIGHHYQVGEAGDDVGVCVADESGWVKLQWRDATTSNFRPSELREVPIPPSLGLAHALNGVPDRPGYTYGLAQRDALGKVSATVYKDSTAVGTVLGDGWGGPYGLHAQARRLIDGSINTAAKK